MYWFGMSDKKEKKETINTCTLEHAQLVFTTIDGKTHVFDRVNYYDKSEMNCHPLTEYLKKKEFLRDNNGVHYPLTSILSIEFIVDDTIENVKKREYVEGLITYVWYAKDEIEIIEN